MKKLLVVAALVALALVLMGQSECDGISWDCGSGVCRVL